MKKTDIKLKSLYFYVEFVTIESELLYVTTDRNFVVL